CVRAVADLVSPYRVWYDDVAGVMYCGWITGATCGIAEAVAVTDDVSAAAGGRPCPLLVDMREMAGITREAREYFTSSSHGITAVALLTASAVTRMIANFFIGLRKAQVPTRMFRSEQDAVAWLTSIR
ncbi:MAG TPA: STAS/SEC14 domain-containing protein, partial [Candidatus Dormibacteraeota bacterium]